MNILVIGGSYFLGKCFVKLAAGKHRITVFNRGNRPLGMDAVKEIHGDRHDEKALAELQGGQYDVVVDFCAYGENDITSVFSTLQGSLKQYIYISTVDVYRHGLSRCLDESAPFEECQIPGEAGAYISGKIALEKELVENAKRYQVSYTSIRPAIIYGPDNYAPREGIYFHWVRQAGQILHPVDASGEFQMVYVEDVATAILNAIANEDAWNQVFNLAPLNTETYDTFEDALMKGMGVNVEKVPVTVATLQEKNIALPFPLTKEESNWYDGKKALTLIGSYTELTEGIRRTVS